MNQQQIINTTTQPGVQTLGNTAEAYASTNNQNNGFIKFSFENVMAMAAGRELARNVRVSPCMAQRMAQQQNPPPQPHNHNNNQTPPGGGRTRGGQFHRGQDVEAKWTGDGIWHPATITSDNRDDTYGIQFTGETLYESRQPASAIRAIRAIRPLVDHLTPASRLAQQTGMYIPSNTCQRILGYEFKRGDYGLGMYRTVSQQQQQQQQQLQQQQQQQQLQQLQQAVQAMFQMGGQQPRQLSRNLTPASRLAQQTRMYIPSNTLIPNMPGYHFTNGDYGLGMYRTVQQVAPQNGAQVQAHALVPRFIVHQLVNAQQQNGTVSTAVVIADHNNGNYTIRYVNDDSAAHHVLHYTRLS